MFKKIRYVLLIVLFFVLMYLWFYFIQPVEFLGSSIRILFFHVPAAWTAVMSFMLSLYFSLRYIRNRNSEYARYAHISSTSGFILLLMAAVSGAVWARHAWNAYWNWDVRQTSISILMLIYAAYFSIRISVQKKQSRDIISSLYLLYASFSVPLFVFIVPRLYDSLHPDLFKDAENNISFDNKIILVLMISLLYFSWFYSEIIIFLIRRKKNNV